MPDINAKFNEADQAIANTNRRYAGDMNISAAIFQGLKLIAWAIVYLADSKKKD